MQIPEPVGHPTHSCTIYDLEAWNAYLAGPECAEEGCLASKDAGGNLIKGHVEERNARAFGEELGNKYCFTCAFWNMHIVERDVGTVITYTAGTPGRLVQYRFDPNDPRPTGPGIRGFSGRKFIVTFDDGRVVETTNLWYQSDVPPWFVDRFPTNGTIKEAIIDYGEFRKAVN